MRKKLCVLFFLGVFKTACTLEPSASHNAKNNDMDATGYRGLTLSVETYLDCQQLQSSIYEQLQQRADNDFERDSYFAKRRSNPITSRKNWDELVASDVLAPESNMAADDARSELEALTNVQVDGVDESDFIKVGRHYIFVVKGDKISIAERQSLAEKQPLSFDDLSDLRIYTPAENLVVLGTSKGHTVVRVYDAGKDSDFTLRREQSFKGRMVDSRITNNRLVLVVRSQLEKVDDYQTVTDVFLETFDHSVGIDADELASEKLQKKPPLSIVSIPKREISQQPLLIEDGKVSGVACHEIVRQAANGDDFTLMQLIVMGLSDFTKDSLVSATIGSGDHVYLDHDAVYIAQRSTPWTPWSEPLEESNSGGSIKAWRGSQSTEKKVIYKGIISAEDGKPQFVAVGSVLGYAKDRYSLQNYRDRDALVIATTTSLPLTNELDDFNLPTSKPYHEQPLTDDISVGEGRNHLWVLVQEGSSLQVVAAIANYGKPGEDIRSVRFVNDYAYVVTFKKTDPLFAFNLEDPLNPVIDGELEIPGFSMYLHPVGRDRLIGVGFDATEHGSFALFQGIQLSLFDVSDPAKMELSAHQVLGGRGSYSDVTGDPRSFFFDSKTEIFAVPVVALGNIHSSSVWRNSAKTTFSGVVFYQLKGKELEELARVSHQHLIPEACLSDLSRSRWWTEIARSQDVNRVFRLGDELLVASRHGLSLFSYGDLKTPAVEMAFSQESCL